MINSYIILGLVGIAVLVAMNIAWDSWRSGRSFCSPPPKPFRDRESQEAKWRQRYADQAMPQADAILKVVCNAFTFNPDDRFKFAPEDRIQGIYQARYPRWKFWQLGDSMEIESLAVRLEKEFGTDLSKWYPEITLGELIDRAIKPGEPDRTH